MTATTLTIQKASFGRWEVLGAPAAYGNRDNEQSPVCPPRFRTRAAAVEFAGRVVGRGEAAGFTVAK